MFYLLTAHFPYFSSVAAAFPAAHLCLGQLLLGSRDLGAAALAEFDLFEEWERYNSYMVSILVYKKGIIILMHIYIYMYIV